MCLHKSKDAAFKESDQYAQPLSILIVFPVCIYNMLVQMTSYYIGINIKTKHQLCLSVVRTCQAKGTFTLTLKAPPRLQQTTFINIFSLFFRENKT